MELTSGVVQAVMLYFKDAGDVLPSYWFSYEPCTISAAPRRLCTWDAEDKSLQSVMFRNAD